MKIRKQASIFILVIIIVSIISGIIYGINKPFDVNQFLNDTNTVNNVFLVHLSILIVFLISTISIIGILTNLLVLGYYSISIGYIITSFIVYYNFKGFIYALILLLFNNIFYLLIMFYLTLTSILFIRKIILNIRGKDKSTYKEILVPILKKYIIIFLFLLIYDTFSSMFLNKFLKMLINVL